VAKALEVSATPLASGGGPPGVYTVSVITSAVIEQTTTVSMNGSRRAT
jgi:hypothetical protein